MHNNLINKMLNKIKNSANTVLLFYLFLFPVLFTGITRGASGPEFDIALKLYENLQFKEAVVKFSILSVNGEGQEKQLSSLFYAKSLIKLNRAGKAVYYLDSLLKQDKRNPYEDETRLTLAEAYVNDSDYANAFGELLLLADKSEDKYYKNYARSSAAKISESLLSSSELRKIIAGKIPDSLKPFTMLLLGKAYLNEFKYDDARNEFLDILQTYPSAAEREEANALYLKAIDFNKKGSGKAVNSPVIGVLLPLSGSQSSRAANEILEGIKFAVSEFNENTQDKTGLLIKDSESKKEKLETIKNEFYSVPGLKTIIGPIYSGEVRDAINVFKDGRLVIISPTATDNDLTFDNSIFFQANPTFTVRGKVMAQYIYFVENKRKMAVLNAAEGYGPVLANSFISEFERLGGKIIVKETYKSGSFNLQAPAAKIASALKQIEGIYIPLSDKVDAPVILSQLDLNKIKLPIYGDQDWLIAKGLNTSSELSSQLTFTSDYFIDFNNPDYKEFNDRFYSQTKTDANRNVLYGYDTAKYLLSILAGLSGNTEPVKGKMEEDVTVDGFHNNICFDRMRINKFLNIVRYRDGVFDLVDKFKLN